MAHQRGASVPDELTEEVISKKKPAFPRDYDHSGWLDVRTRATKPWKRRFFVLANNFLLCGVTPHATKLEKVIPLEGSNVKTTIRTSTMTFEILHKKKRHQFRAPNIAECTTWTERISRASRLKIKDVYKFQEILGQNPDQSTQVWAARHIVRGDDVAIKIISKRKYDPRALQNEVLILKRLDHPNVVKLYDLFETRNSVYLVMEKCLGGELFEQIAAQDGHGFCEKDCITIVHQIAKAVKYMHSMGIVHRDLKPENILCVDINSIKKIKIADFGISKVVFDPEQRKKEKDKVKRRREQAKRNRKKNMDKALGKNNGGNQSINENNNGNNQKNKPNGNPQMNNKHQNNQNNQNNVNIGNGNNGNHNNMNGRRNDGNPNANGNANSQGNVSRNGNQNQNQNPDPNQRQNVNKNSNGQNGQNPQRSNRHNNEMKMDDRKYDENKRDIYVNADGSVNSNLSQRRKHQGSQKQQYTIDNSNYTNGNNHSNNNNGKRSNGSHSNHSNHSKHQSNNHHNNTKSNKHRHHKKKKDFIDPLKNRKGKPKGYGQHQHDDSWDDYKRGTDYTMSTMCGTISYTAPEILNELPYDRRVDYWSLGVIMYILLCGYPPFAGESEIEVARAILNDTVELEPEDWTHVSEQGKQLVLGLLAKEPKTRLGCDDIIGHGWIHLAKDSTSKRARQSLIQTVVRRRIRKMSMGVFEQNSKRLNKMYRSRDDSSSGSRRSLSGSTSLGPRHSKTDEDLYELRIPSSYGSSHQQNVPLLNE